ncbi:hypothetical protein B0H11DRAFT_2121106 [Mycena galericulata]|nr:hypothetical protein B0H11DRAFT_2121106 [Mycena galericulata]
MLAHENSASPPNLTLRDAPHLWLRFDGEDSWESLEQGSCAREDDLVCVGGDDCARAGMHACLWALPSKHRTANRHASASCGRAVPGHCIRGGTTSCITVEDGTWDLRHRARRRSRGIDDCDGTRIHFTIIPGGPSIGDGHAMQPMNSDIDSLLLHTSNAGNLGRIKLRHAWDLRHSQAASCVTMNKYGARPSTRSTQRDPAGVRAPLLQQLRLRRVNLLARRPRRRRLRRWCGSPGWRARHDPLHLYASVEV